MNMATQQMKKTMDTYSSKPSILSQLLIVIGLLCLLIGPNFGPIPSLLRQSLSIEPSVIALLFSFLIGFSIIIFVALKMDGWQIGDLASWLREAGLGKPTRWTAAIVGAIVGIAWGGLLLMSILQFDPEANLLEVNLFRVLAAGLAIIGTIMEDIIGRGYLMNRLKQINVPNWGQAVLSALTFAFYHTVWAFSLPSFIASIIYGLMLSGLFLWGKRSLTPVILGHAVAVLIGEPFATKLLFLVQEFVP